MSDYYNKYNKRELKRVIKGARANYEGGESQGREVLKIQIGKAEDNYVKRFGELDFRKGGMVVSTKDNRKNK